MPTTKPRFIITLESEEQHELLKEFSRLQGQSVSAIINGLLADALRPLTSMRRLAANPSNQVDLIEFLQAITGIGGGLSTAPAPAADDSPSSPLEDAAVGPRGAPEHTAQGQRSEEPAARRKGRRRGVAPPYGNTGVGFEQTVETTRK